MKLQWRDIVERFVLGVFVCWLAWRIVSAIMAGETHWVSALVLVGELLVLYFIIIGRPATGISTSLREWIVAFAGTAAPLCTIPGGQPLASDGVIAVLFLAGIAAQLTAKLSLNRSFGMVPANRGVVTTGLYAFVRHPVYASYLIGHVAFLLANPTLWNVAVYAAGFALQLVRMNAEENFLIRDPAYATYRGMVPYRLLPGVY